jgi:DNA polymerase III epsilon subunit-like protein
MAPQPETYVSVDVETAGPNPADYALLSIGACLVDDPEQTFYVELQPVTDRSVPEALEISGLSLERLARDGLPPAQAMGDFAAWLQRVVPPNRLPVFVGFNAAFDWMFVADYFHRYLGHNPFGHTALDIKAFYMGLSGVAWSETTKAALAARFPDHPTLTHHALQDALDQAALFRRMRQEARSHDSPFDAV